MCNPVTYHIINWISDCSSLFSVLLPLSAQLLTLFTQLHTFSLRLKEASATRMLQVYVAARVLGMTPEMAVTKSLTAVCRQSFASTRLSATRMLHFVEERQECVRRLVLMNSEGYWSGE